MPPNDIYITNTHATSGVTFAPALPNYQCPVHGNIESATMHLLIFEQEQVDAIFCLRCYLDFLRAHVSQVTLVTETAVNPQPPRGGYGHECNYFPCKTCGT